MSLLYLLYQRYVKTVTNAAYNYRSCMIRGVTSSESSSDVQLRSFVEFIIDAIHVATTFEMFI